VSATTPGATAGAGLRFGAHAIGAHRARPATAPVGFAWLAIRVVHPSVRFRAPAEPLVGGHGAFVRARTRAGFLRATGGTVRVRAGFTGAIGGASAHQSTRVGRRRPTDIGQRRRTRTGQRVAFRRGNRVGTHAIGAHRARPITAPVGVAFFAIRVGHTSLRGGRSFAFVGAGSVARVFHATRRSVGHAAGVRGTGGGAGDQTARVGGARADGGQRRCGGTRQ
jgi:hypothetical protein